MAGLENRSQKSPCGKGPNLSENSDNNMHLAGLLGELLITYISQLAQVPRTEYLLNE
jgi:hypothetical protein